MSVRNVIMTAAGALSGAAEAYQIERSLRFNSADSAYLNRTPASAGNRKTWTWSGWVKPSSGEIYLLQARVGVGTTPHTTLRWSSDKLRLLQQDGSNQILLDTNAVFRDYSAWYHVVCAVDTTQATESNRVSLYVNGVLQSLSTATYPTQNLDTAINNNIQHLIGSQFPNSGSQNFQNGYLTEINFIDGSALTPSSFGEINATTGVWSPIRYAGSYGTNGFYLNFSDNSNTTAATLGKDQAGSNDWTLNNFSVAAGAGNDSLVDTPTPYGTDTGVGGEIRSNYATLNPLDTAGSSTVTPTDGNLKMVGLVNNSHIRATQAIISGKYYWEVTFLSATPNFHHGVSTIPSLNTIGSAFLGGISGTWGYWPNTSGSNDAYWRNNGSNIFTNLPRAVQNDVMMFAVDADTGRIWIGLNGTWFNSGNPVTGTNALSTNLPTDGTPIFPHFMPYDNGTGHVVNFGQRPFAYTAPTGFKALCTRNLPNPTVVQGDEYFNTVLYTGTGSARSVTGVGFQPDFVWVKGRSQAYSNSLADVLRGPTLRLKTNSTDVEAADMGLTSFDSDGFTFNGSNNNNSGETFVAWNWKANGAGVTNTAGSITSTVSANTDSGFSIVTYTGVATDNSNFTVGHGLSLKPAMIIIKNRGWAASSKAWPVFHQSISTGGVFLDSTDLSEAQNFNLFWGAQPNSTTFSIRSDSTVSAANRYRTNGRTDGYVAYCFAEIEGYSKFGAYVGNGSADGPFVYTGFRPRWILYKAALGTAYNWGIYDTARDRSNGAVQNLAPNAADADTNYGVYMDILSNGFKCRASGNLNESGSTYIYMAFAEHPFKYALAR